MANHPGLTPFQPGKSGNPGGRTKRDKLIREAWQRMIKADGSDKSPIDEYVALCRNIMNDGKASNRDRLLAGNALHDRGYGPPVQHVVLEEDVAETAIDWSQVPEEQREKILEALQLLETVGASESVEH